jgi:hypothetical protein
MLNITLVLLTSSARGIEAPPPFGKGFCGLFRQLKWDTNGRWEMGGK